MKLVTYERNGQRSIGVLSDRGVIDLPAASGGALPADLLTLLQQGDAALAQARNAVARGQAIPLADVQLKALLPRPGKIIGIGLNYADHAAEGGREKPKYPMIFTKAVSAVIGTGEPIRIPPVTQAVDFEGELAVVIGKRAKDVPPKDALDYVAGYTICNDVSARDYQQRSSPTAGKSFDTFAPLGTEGASYQFERANGEVRRITMKRFSAEYSFYRFKEPVAKSARRARGRGGRCSGFSPRDSP